MIKINRCSCPSVLIKAPKSGDRYRNKKVVQALWGMQHGKCCYCESSIPEAGHRKAVEHFYPKSIFKGKRNEWKNLLLVCPQCNGKKSDHFPIMLTNNDNEAKIVYLKAPKQSIPLIIDPSDNSDNPEDHLSYNFKEADRLTLCGQIIPKNNSIKGENTIKITGIGEPFIQRIRRNHYLNVIRTAYHSLLIALNSGNNAQLNSAIINYETLMCNNNEFAGMAREFAKEMNFETEFTPLSVPN